jgi:ABC-type Fe3+/spermidine/putrescine transport system ATPase subunit
MRGGRLEQVGTPAEVYERPASPFVARFVGGANLIEGTVGERGVETRLGRLAVGNGLERGARVFVVARPEHVLLEPTADGSGGEVRTQAFRGDTVEHVVELDGLVVRARTDVRRSIPNGTRVGVRFDESALMVVRDEGAEAEL